MLPIIPTEMMAYAETRLLLTPCWARQAKRRKQHHAHGLQHGSAITLIIACSSPQKNHPMPWSYRLMLWSYPQHVIMLHACNPSFSMIHVRRARAASASPLAAAAVAWACACSCLALTFRISCSTASSDLAGSTKEGARRCTSTFPSSYLHKHGRHACIRLSTPQGDKIRTWTLQCFTQLELTYHQRPACI